MLWKIRRFFRDLSRAFAYARRGWNSYDWDFAYLWEDIRFKLIRMREEQLHRSHHLHNERYAREIHVCVLLLNRILADNYHENVFAEHDARWGKLEWIEGARGVSTVAVSLRRQNARTAEEAAREREEHTRLYKHEEYLKRQDVALLLDIIKRKHGGWWT